MNKRLIVLNTVVSYVRSLLTAGITLFSTRWVLEALGKVDLGLYYVVGGVVMFLSFINTSMSFSSQRHFAYAIGRGGASEVQKWFNSSLAIHVVLALAFLLLSIPLGFVAFKYWLKIPEGREIACCWVYICSVFTAAASILSVPYNAIYIARQHIYELSIIQILNAIALLGLTAWLRSFQGDRLLAYALGMLGLSVLVATVQIVRCRYSFPESVLDLGLMKSRSRCRELLSFSGWSLTSTFAYILRGQGVALLLNNYGTSGSNAAYGIANHVSVQTGFLANGLMSAISPEMTKMEGEGLRKEMICLATRACKLVTFLILFVALPPLTDVEPLLALWLKDVPEGTTVFFRIMLIAFLVIQSVLGVTVATKAVGKIALPEVCAAVALLFAIPVAYLSIIIGLPISFVVGSVALTACLCALSTLICAHYIFKYPVQIWVNEVLVGNMFLVVIVIIINLSLHQVMDGGLLRLILVTVVDWSVLLSVGWSFVLKANERAFVETKLRSFLSK